MTDPRIQQLTAIMAAYLPPDGISKDDFINCVIEVLDPGEASNPETAVIEAGKCLRCEVLEDLLNTATSDRDKARDEAAKADREALSLKAAKMHWRAQDAQGSYETLCYFQDLARSLGATPSQLLERE